MIGVTIYVYKKILDHPIVISLKQEPVPVVVTLNE